jgi:hypothetical protein
VVVSAYGPRSEKTENEGEVLLESLSDSGNMFEHSEMIIMLGDMDVGVDMKPSSVLVTEPLMESSNTGGGQLTTAVAYGYIG